MWGGAWALCCVCHLDYLKNPDFLKTRTLADGFVAWWLAL